MNLTLRGAVTAVAAVAAFALAGMYGARSLNAVAAPALVALLAAIVQVKRAEPPTVRRNQPEPGFPGDVRQVRLDVETQVPCTIRDRIDSGVHPITEPGGDFAGSGTVRYDLTLRDRGEYHLGPATATISDGLGLLTHEYVGQERTAVLVYPTIHPVAGRRAIATLVERADTPERAAFDSLREYTPGDALRDIDWKSSAKRTDDEFIVTEYTDVDESVITVAAEGEPGCADAMASAAASVAQYLLDARLAVEVVTPSGRCDPGMGDEHRSHIYGLLARARDGRIGRTDRDDADVHIHAAGDGTSIRVGGSEVTFEDLLDADGPATREVAVA